MKRDHKKIFKGLYSPKAFTPEIVEVPTMSYLMLSGSGRPDGESFARAAATLFPVAYVAKFIVKAERPEEDYTVMPMEVKWRLNRETHGPGRYSWTMMLMQPECVDIRIVEKAVETLLRKEKVLPLRERLRLAKWTEGPCGQILHIGPYEEPMERSFGILKERLKASGYAWEPDSHDVYFNDIRRTPPEKLKTLIRVRIWPEGETPGGLDDPFALWG